MSITYLLIQCGFALITFFFYGVLLVVIRTAINKTSRSLEQKRKLFLVVFSTIAGWFAISMLLSLSGFLRDFTTVPPRFLIILVIPFITIIVVLNRKATREILAVTPGFVLIYLQVFRVFVEILLWGLFAKNLLPVQMTFEGRNFDVLSGLSAPIVGWLMQYQKVSRKVVIAWNLICLGILINIVVTALLSIPSPFRYFMNEPANTIVAEFPIVWLPALLVPLAYGLHLLSIKQLFMKK